ncbi:MAG: ATP synthase F1 subunit epsilon [Rickettsiaceae bacterium]
MGKEFQLKIINSKEIIFDKLITNVVIPGIEGEFGVLYDHAPFISLIAPGIIKAQIQSSDGVKYFVYDGMVSVESNTTLIIVEFIVDMQTVSKNEVNSTMSLYKEKLHTIDDIKNSEHLYIQNKISQYNALLEYL